MLLDTNIFVAYLNGDRAAKAAISEWKENGQALFISVISTAEVLAAPRINPEEYERLKLFLSNFISIPLDDKFAEAAALIRRKYNLELPDAFIAATAVIHRLPLVTRDKQFRKISEITVIEI